MLYFRVLGPLDVQRVEGDATAINLTRPLERRLLAVLLAARGRIQSTDELIDALWPSDGPSQPERALQTTVSRLRKILGSTGSDSVIARAAGGYHLAVDDEQVDANRFEHAISHAATLAPDDRLRTLDEAVGLWRGTDAYADFRYEDFALGEAARLEELRLNAIEALLDARLAAGESDRVIADVEVLIKEHPLRERLYGMLMLALYRAGREAEALRVYQNACDHLVDELGIKPSRALTELEEQILLQDPRLDLADRANAGPNNLPGKMTSIVGRADDLAAVGARLNAARMVTITGPGGVGKTTVAIESARGVRDRYPDGCWLVALEGIGNAEQVAETIGAALRRPLPAESDPEESIRALINQLASAHLLLVVDNCEHLVDEVAHVAQRILEACPDVSILATSLERLVVPGEVVLPLAPLEVGTRVPMGVNAGEAVARSPALTLFQDRAQAVDPTFSIDESTLELAMRICHRLDGLPLALELAAAQLGVLSLTEINSQLDRRFDMLRVERASTSRHLTLEAAIDWSCQLLDDDHRRAIQQLATIVTPFDGELVAAVTGKDAAETLSVLRSLRGKSLLQIRRDASVGTRYEFLQSVRAYARGRAAADGWASADMGAHADAFRELAARARRGTLGGANQLRWLRLVHDAATDFEQAIDTYLSQDDVADAAGICSDVGWVFLAYRDQEQGYRLASKVLDAAGSSIDRNIARVHIIAAGLLLINGVGTHREGAHNTAVQDHLAIAREMAEHLSSASIAMEASLWDGYHHWYMGKTDRAVEILAAIRDTAIEHGLDRAVMFASLGVGGALNLGGARHEAIEHMRHALALAQSLDDGFMQSWAYTWLGSALRDTGDFAGAAAAYHDGFLVAARFGFPMYASVGAAGEALSLCLANDPRAARQAATRAVAIAASRPASDAYLSFQNLMADADLGMSGDELATRIRMVFIASKATRADRLLELLLHLSRRHAEHNRLDPLLPVIDAALERLPIPSATPD